MTIFKKSESNSKIQIIENKETDKDKLDFLNEFYKLGSASTDAEKIKLMSSIINNGQGVLRASSNKTINDMTLEEMEDKIYNLFKFFKSV